MKGKKMILAAVALTLAAGFAFGMAGCSGGATSNAKKIKSEEVTEEQWNAIFGLDQTDSEDDGTLEDCKMEATVTYDSQTYQNGVLLDVTNVIEWEIIIDGGKDYVKSKSWQKGKYGEITIDDENPETIVYSEKSEKNGVPVYYQYTQNAAFGWEKDVASGMAGQTAYETFFDILSVALQYDMYVYSEDANGYVVKQDLKGQGPVFKFKDGKLVGIYMQMENFEDGHEVVTCDLVITYGDQTVNLPTEFTDNTTEAEEI